MTPTGPDTGQDSPAMPARGDEPPTGGPPAEPDDDGWDGRDEEAARWLRPVLVVVAVIGLLLLGAAGGLLIGLPGAPTPTPTAESVDVGFLQDMTVHHQQAVEMAAWERDRTTDPYVGKLAADIETTQNSQVGRMQGWLDLWNAAPLPVGGHMGWMAEPTHDHGAGDVLAMMPGMADAEDLAALRAASGPELDILFLQLMLRHHEGGRGMAEYAAQHASVPQIRNLAAQMLSSQSAESDYLRQLLAERGAQPLPSP